MSVRARAACLACSDKVVYGDLRNRSANEIEWNVFEFLEANTALPHVELLSGLCVFLTVA